MAWVRPEVGTLLTFYGDNALTFMMLMCALKRCDPRFIPAFA